MKKFIVLVGFILLIASTSVSACSNGCVINLERKSKSKHAIICKDGSNMFCSKHDESYWQCGNSQAKYFSSNDSDDGICNNVAIKHCAANMGVDVSACK